MKILIDMNLSPSWVEVLARHGWQAVHWSTIGDPKAADKVLFDWARRHRFVVSTSDLDFGRLLALTHDSGPSVIQVRSQDVLPGHLEERLAGVLTRFEADLGAGALVTVDESKSRIRILPLSRRTQ